MGTVTTYASKFIAFLLVAGGLLGIVASVQMTIHFAHEQHLYRVVVAVISLAIFVWCSLKGIDLWQGKPSGYRWAKVLFALQIPVICISRFTYEFSTGLSARIIFGHSS